MTEVEEQIQGKQKDLETKTAAFEQTVVDLREREASIEELKQTYVTKEAEL